MNRFQPRAGGPGSTAAPPAPPADPELVIRQARARQRRRRRRTAAVVAAVILTGARVWLAIARPGGAKPGYRPWEGPVPSVDAAAFAGHGELAFVSRGTLWVLDSRTRTLRRVAASGMAPVNPAFSPDGRWLAFLGTSTNRPAGTASFALWIASGDGRGAHQIRGLPTAGLAGWSPDRDILAVTTRATVRLVWPSGKVRTLVSAADLESAAWSPGGSAIAVATATTSGSTLASYPLAGGHSTVWVKLSARGGVPGGANYIIDPAGWWPHRGIGFWALANGESINADQDPFYVIPAPGAHPRLLGNTLHGNTLDQVAVAATGWLALVAETPGSGLGRVIWQNRRIKVCGPATATCTAVPSPPSTVTLDPAWTPDGTRLAFVRAPSQASPAFQQHAVTAWYNAHQLWVDNPATRSTRKLDASGATVPAWSTNGQSLLYIARDGIWLLPRLTRRPVRIATPLFPPGNWPTYYGQVDWTPQFAWWSG